MKSLILNESKFFIRQPLVWITGTLMSLFALVLAEGTGSISDLPLKQMQMTSMGLLMLALPLAFAAISPVMYARDRLSNMHELISVAPITYNQRLYSRWLTLVLFQWLFLACCDLIFALHANLDADVVLFALFNWLFLGLPVVALLASFSLWVMEKFNSTFLIYVVFILFWLGYTILASMTGSPILAGSKVVNENLMTFMQIFDPYGITALMAGLQQEGELTLLSPSLLANRIGCLVAALILLKLALSTKSFEFNLFKRSGKTVQEELPEQLAFESTPGFRYQRVIQSPQSLRILGRLILSDIQGILTNKLNILLLCGWPILVFEEILSGIGYAEAMSVLEPTSFDALNRVAWDLIPIMGSLLTLLFSWQICWRSKASDMAELISVAPIKSLILSVSHLLSLILLLAFVVLLGAMGAFVAEAIAGSVVVPTHYLAQFGISYLSLITMAIVFVAIHTLIHQRLIAMLVIFLVLLVKFSPLMQALGMTHPLWDIFTIPVSPPDMFWGYSGSMSTILPYSVFWLINSLALLSMAVAFSHRDAGINNFSMSKVKSSFVVLGVSILSIVSAVGIFSHQISSEVPLVTAEQSRIWRIDYEREYSHWLDIAQPTVKAVDSVVDIYPQQGYAAFELTYTLTNPSNEPIRKVLVGGWGNTLFSEASLDGAELELYDERLNQRVFQLERPMNQGEELKFTVKFEYRQPSLLPADLHHIVKPDFTYIRSVPLLPHIGFNRNAMIRSNEVREEYGMAPTDVVLPSEYYSLDQTIDGRYDFVEMKTRVSTRNDQYAIAQGALIRDWVEGKRRYFEYETSQAIRNIPVWLSVPFEPVERIYQNIDLKIYAPKPDEASDLHMTAMQDTIKWFEDNIHPYPGEQLNLVAFPNIGPTGYALPQTMLINNRVGFRAKPSEKAVFDQRYRRTVHETAHQWFGHLIGSGAYNDRSFLIESMAKYVELVMLERRYGNETAQALFEYEEGRYRIGQARSSRPTLALVDAEESHDQYSRATLVFSRLREAMGDEPIIAAIKQLFDEHAYPKTPATSMDFVRALKRHTEQAHHHLIDQLLLQSDISILFNKSEQEL